MGAMLDINKLGVLDHYDDGGMFLTSKFSGELPPEIAAYLDTDVLKKHASVRYKGDFALTCDTGRGMSYRYPVATPEQAAISAAYFAEYGEKLPVELQKTAAATIQGALQSFGLATAEALTKTASIEVTEVPDTFWNELFGFDENSMERLEDEVLASSPRGKRKMLVMLKEASPDVFKDLPEELQELAGDSVGTDFNLHMALREKLFGEDAYVTVREKVSAASPDELISMLHAADQESGAVFQYGRHVADPAVSVMSSRLVTKQASSGVEVDGEFYGADTIEAWARGGGVDKLREAFNNPDLSEQFGQDPVGVLSSLPLPVKKAIIRMM